jgi:hypothetical protein
MIKLDGKNGSDWIQKWEAKTGERRKIRLPRSGFVHLNRVLSVVLRISKHLDMGFGQHCKIVFMV